MKKTTLLKIVNTSIAVLFLVQTVTGIGSAFLPMQVFEVHRYSGYLFSALVVAHVALNWTWVRATFFKKTKSTASPVLPRGQNKG
jgi:hypothetical protein